MAATIDSLPPELIAQILTAGASSFSPKELKLRRHYLLATSLVSSKWTFPSQFLLHRKIHMWSEKTGLAFIESPSFITEELALDSAGADPCSLSVRTATKVLAKTRGLKKLKLSYFERGSLSLNCLTAPSLSELKSLTLEHVAFHHSNNDVTLPFSLSHLSIIGSLPSLPSFRPLFSCSTSTLTSLHLFFSKDYTPRPDEEIISTLSLVAPTVTSLSFTNHSETRLIKAFPHFTSLRDLELGTELDLVEILQSLPVGCDKEEGVKLQRLHIGTPPTSEWNARWLGFFHMMRMISTEKCLKELKVLSTSVGCGPKSDYRGWQLLNGEGYALTRRCYESRGVEVVRAMFAPW